MKTYYLSEDDIRKANAVHDRLANEAYAAKAKGDERAYGALAGEAMDLATAIRSVELAHYGNGMFNAVYKAEGPIWAKVKSASRRYEALFA